MYHALCYALATVDVTTCGMHMRLVLYMRASFT